MTALLACKEQKRGKRRELHFTRELEVSSCLVMRVFLLSFARTRRGNVLETWRERRR